MGVQISEQHRPTIYPPLEWISIPLRRLPNLNFEPTPSIERVPTDSTNHARRYILLSSALNAPFRKTATMSAVLKVRMDSKEIQIPAPAPGSRPEVRCQAMDNGAYVRHGWISSATGEQQTR